MSICARCKRRVPAQEMMYQTLDGDVCPACYLEYYLDSAPTAYGIPMGQEFIVTMDRIREVVIDPPSPAPHGMKMHYLYLIKMGIHEVVER